MRLQQLKSLSELELGLLLIVVNDYGARHPEISSINELTWLRNDAILWKLSQSEHKLNDQGKVVFKELMRKLNMQSHEEAKEFAEKSKPDYTQLEFELYSQLEFKF